MQQNGAPDPVVPMGGQDCHATDAGRAVVTKHQAPGPDGLAAKACGARSMVVAVVATPARPTM